MFRCFYVLVFFTFFINLQAQKTNKDVLFTVAKEPVYSEEFIRIFNKNLDLVKDESQKDVDSYLKLFVNYKLKIKEAQAKGLDTMPTYLREFESYKKQLAKNYLTDTKVTEALVEEAYHRLSNEVKASHILIRLDEGASPQDTLEVYNELLKLKERIENEGYAQVQKDVHDGKKVYAENLGYFSAFKMVYDFENVAYTTKVGEVSMPFKTQFGYHIVMVEDERDSRGELKVAHIMVANKRDDKQQNSKTRIQEIYKKINQGEAFSSLAKQFSEDKSSVEKGGELVAFSGGELSSSEFEEVAFSLEKEGQVSKPFETGFGWHIIKLIKKTELASFDAMKPELEGRVKRDSRSKLINTSLVNNLKERYSIKGNPEGLRYFETILNEGYFLGNWSLPQDFTSNKILVVIANKELTYKDFGDYLFENQRRVSTKKAFDILVSENYEDFINANLIQYQEENLENENEDFSHIVTEYRDGLLLFDLMEKEIWNASQTDSVALKSYYKTHKNNYIWNQRIDADVASASKKRTIKTVKEMLGNGQSPESIKEALNKNDKVYVIFTSGIMEKDHQALTSDMLFEKGVSNIYRHDNAYVVANIKDVLPKTHKIYEEAKGQISSDYQVVKERLWLQELEQKFPVHINSAVLAKVKANLKTK
ncbi:peptidylprolyl isomerase [Bizionia argentinensis JUB59]|uniref:Peptidylprolyl isomerase n=1 Tax=Bizionia argentinensis JUB59 TaxID=1046627 RepID=G2E8X3_9FLAO|nr:peptidylprolyl isomerase [Bizionia argentinensis]EGV45113.1 peptidylprolyl isomerase [Bizionia argentinensis JUB59]